MHYDLSTMWLSKRTKMYINTISYFMCKIGFFELCPENYISTWRVQLKGITTQELKGERVK